MLHSTVFELRRRGTQNWYALYISHGLQTVWTVDGTEFPVALKVETNYSTHMATNDECLFVCELHERTSCVCVCRDTSGTRSNDMN
jgi:hypothetical protein